MMLEPMDLPLRDGQLLMHRMDQASPHNLAPLSEIEHDHS
jgi:hypothetical protein